MTLGEYLRFLREQRQVSLRSMAKAAGIEPGYLSRIERDEVPPPSEEVIVKLAAALGEDPNVLLAMAGKVSDRLRRIICKRPQLFAALIEQLDKAPDEAIQAVASKVRDGKW